MDITEPITCQRKIEYEPTARGVFDGFFSWLQDDPIYSNGPNESALAVPPVLTGMDSSSIVKRCRKNAIAERNVSKNASPITLFGENAALPQFTSRDEMLEFESLTAEEIAASEADVLGLTSDMADMRIDDGVVTAALDVELGRIPITEKAAYVEATQKCPELVDGEHKKAFFRREGHNAKLAAKRLCKYWEYRRNLFGKERCYLPLTLAGALRDDTIALQNCVLRLLPTKDAWGRTILLWDPSLHDPELYSHESMVRACWFMYHAASNDQQHGFVVIFSPNGSAPNLSKLELAKSIIDLEITYMPSRCRSVHFFRPGPVFHLLSPIFKHFMGKRLRERFKVHYGSVNQVLQSLEEYGIQRSCLPIELGGDIVLDQDQWLADRFAEERKNVSAVAIASAPGGVDCMADTSSWEPIRIGTGAQSPVCERWAHQPTFNQFGRDTVTRQNDTIKADRITEREQDREASTIGSPREKISARNSSSQECANNSAWKHGNKGDPRMNQAVKSKLENPDISLTDALLEGGFNFLRTNQSSTNAKSSSTNAKSLLDTEGVSLYQRKNQLMRRLRESRKKNDIKEQAFSETSERNHRRVGVTSDEVVDSNGNLRIPVSTESTDGGKRSEQVLVLVDEKQDYYGRSADANLCLSSLERSTPPNNEVKGEVQVVSREGSVLALELDPIGNAGAPISLHAEAEPLPDCGESNQNRRRKDSVDAFYGSILSTFADFCDADKVF